MRSISSTGHRVRRPVVELRRSSATRAPAICWACERLRPVPSRTPAVGRTCRLDAVAGGGRGGSGPPGGLRPRSCDELGRGGRRDVDAGGETGARAARPISSTATVGPPEPVRDRLGRDGCAAGRRPARAGARHGPGTTVNPSRRPTSELTAPPAYPTDPSGCLPTATAGARSRTRLTCPMSKAARQQLQHLMRDAEADIAEALSSEGWLTVLDGSLRGIRHRRGLPVIGYVKTHHRRMLTCEHWVRVPELTAGEQSGLFRGGGAGGWLAAGLGVGSAPGRTSPGEPDADRGPRTASAPAARGRTPRPARGAGGGARKQPRRTDGMIADRRPTGSPRPSATSHQRAVRARQPAPAALAGGRPGGAAPGVHPRPRAPSRHLHRAASRRTLRLTAAPMEWHHPGRTRSAALTGPAGAGRDPQSYRRGDRLGRPGRRARRPEARRALAAAETPEAPHFRNADGPSSRCCCSGATTGTTCPHLTALA